MPGLIEAPDAWRGLSTRIDSEGGTILLLGASDSGKTTLLRWLMRTLTAAGRRVALVDSDIGQSTVGPPATVGLAFAAPTYGDPGLPPIALRFVGAVSPAGQDLPLAAGLRRLADKASAMGAEVLLVDTTGFVLGPAARRLKYHKIDLLAPRRVIALQRDEELEPILRLFEARKGMAISRLPVSPHAVARSFQVRRSYRAQRFADYFRGSSLVELPLHGVGLEGGWIRGGRPLDPTTLRGLSDGLGVQAVWGERIQDEAFLLVRGEPASEAVSLAKSRLGVSAVSITTIDGIRGLLLGLAEGDDELLALGLLQDLDPASGRMVCLSPCADPTRVGIVHFGSIRLDPSGEELGESANQGVEFHM
jgi:polynucleotide 5'-hydroxyl-kinase GRC3/NOL9